MAGGRWQVLFQCNIPQYFNRTQITQAVILRPLFGAKDPGSIQETVNEVNRGSLRSPTPLKSRSRGLRPKKRSQDDMG